MSTSVTLSDAHRELLQDKFVLWERASRQGPMDLRDYNARAAEALKAALAICSTAQAAEARVAEADRVIADFVAWFENPSAQKDTSPYQAAASWRSGKGESE